MGSAMGFAAARRGRRVVRRGMNFIVTDGEKNYSVCLVISWVDVEGKLLLALCSVAEDE
jgi:hypothetical protein